ncbi:hypothetical protein FRC12_008819 [Ceratobasidium sp. 428]|nr:hypothetical protein FRC12_008819 [Ceratobasidium sp. 428]
MDTAGSHAVLLVGAVRKLAGYSESPMPAATEEGTDGNHDQIKEPRQEPQEEPQEEPRGKPWVEDACIDSPGPMSGVESENGNLGINNIPEGRGRPTGTDKSVEETLSGNQPLVTNTPTQAQVPDVPGAAQSALLGEPIRPASSLPITSGPPHRRDSSEHQLPPIRTQALVQTLRTLHLSQTLGEHVALVKHLQFSSDGQFLATCSWDKTVLIWKIGLGAEDGFGVLHKLVHSTPQMGDFVGQVGWSPKGEQLLTKQLKSVKVWDGKAGTCNATVNSKRWRGPGRAQRYPVAVEGWHPYT